MKKFYDNFINEIRTNPALFIFLVLMVILVVVYSNYVSALNTIPLAPSDLTLGNPTSPNMVILEWVDNADNEDHFVIERKLNTESVYTFLGQVGTDVTSYIDTASIIPGMVLDYRVQACLTGVGCSSYVTLEEAAVVNFNQGGGSGSTSGGGGGFVSGSGGSSASGGGSSTVPGGASAINPTTIPTTSTTGPTINTNTNTITTNTNTNTTPTNQINNSTNSLNANTTEIDEIIPTNIQDLTVSFDSFKEIINNNQNQPQALLEKQDIKLLYQDSNKDGISDYESIYVFDISPTQASPTSIYQGKKINAAEKVLLGYDINKTELVSVPKEEPTISTAPAVSLYKIEEIKLTEEKKVVFKGKALPNSFITLYIYSTPIMVTVKTDSHGEWQYTMDQELANGRHTVYTATVNNTGKILAKSSGSTFTKTAEAATIENFPPINGSSDLNKPGLLNRTNIYLFIGAILIIFVLVLVLTGLVTKKKN